MFCVDQQHLVPVCSQDALHQVEVPQVQPCLLLIVSRAVLRRAVASKATVGVLGQSFWWHVGSFLWAGNLGVESPGYILGHLLY